MRESIVSKIAACMAVKGEIQTDQTEHRVKLAESWGIEAGSKILEIGCGQGDTTAVLAYFTGEKGHVHAIDIAGPDYGSPVTLGESREYLLASSLGKQMDIQFQVDVLADNVTFPEKHFDYIVFSHASWYLRSADELSAILKKSRSWGKKLCFAEWDPAIQHVEQQSHILAVLLQAQYEAFKESSESNVRSLFTVEDIKDIIEGTGWNVVKEESIYSPKLKDGEWEVDMAIEFAEEELKQLPQIPGKLKELIQSEIRILQRNKSMFPIRPLSTIALTAE
ncbi:methyltransferase domain-containing protein [Halomonas sp. MG34]|nr:methyltransferase domain-containing protein [Halomonas sp. MG34]